MPYRRTDNVIRKQAARHRAIVEAIGLREGTRAESLAREHARVSRQNLARALGDRTLFKRLPGSSLITLPHPASFA